MLRARVHGLIRSDWDWLDTDRARFFLCIGAVLGIGLGASTTMIVVLIAGAQPCAS